MTDIKLSKKGKPLWRRSTIKIQDRFLVVGLRPEAIVLRMENTRQEYTLPLSLAYLRAAELAAKAAKPIRHHHTVRRGALAL